MYVYESDGIVHAKDSTSNARIHAYNQVVAKRLLFPGDYHSTDQHEISMVIMYLFMF